MHAVDSAESQLVFSVMAIKASLMLQAVSPNVNSWSGKKEDVPALIISPVFGGNDAS